MRASPNLIGIGSGLVAAVLFASLANNSLLALMLFYLTPLPVLLAGVGWGVRAALLSALTASVLVGLFLNLLTAVVFALCIGIPGVILSYLTLLRRAMTAPVQAGGQPPRGPLIEWYPPGRIIAWSAVMASGLVALIAVVFVLLGGDSEGYRHGVHSLFDDHALKLFQGMFGAGFGRADLDRIADEIARYFLPAFAGSFWQLILLGNLWLAAKSAAISGLLDRPSPDFRKFDYPPLLFAGFFLALAMSFVPGLLGIVGVAFLSAFAFPYLVLGMSVAHSLTARLLLKPFLLFILYVGLFLTPWVAPIILVVGLLEPFLRLRQRSLQPLKPPGSAGGPRQ